MKKLNKFVAVLVALAMMAALAVTSAFAADGDDQYKDASVDLTKFLEMPAKTSAPNGKFVFTVTAKDGQETVENATKNLEVTYNGEQVADNATSVKKTAKLFDGVTWPHAGVYTYTIKEDSAASYQKGTGETLTYDKSEYKVEVSVKNKPGTTDEVYVAAIYVVKTVDADGNAIPEAQQKKNSTNPTGEQGEITDGTFSFTNKFYKTTNVTPDGGDPTTTKDNTGLYVEKTVTGELGDKTKDFTFSVTVTAPTLAETDPAKVYHATVVDVNADDTTKAVDTYEFTSGTANANVKLKDGYRLVFTDLDIGATYTVQETADSSYTTKYDGDANVTSASGTVAETANKVDVENASKDSEIGPEGILISNLPYIVLALVAVGGLCAYVVVRRKADDEA